MDAYADRKQRYDSNRQSRVGKTAISEGIARLIINGEFKTVISCQRARARGPCRALSRITEGSFVVGRKPCWRFKPFVAEAVISRLGPQEP